MSLFGFLFGSKPKRRRRKPSPAVQRRQAERIIRSAAREVDEKHRAEDRLRRLDARLGRQREQAETRQRRQAERAEHRRQAAEDARRSRSERRGPSAPHDDEIQRLMRLAGIDRAHAEEAVRHARHLDSNPSLRLATALAHLHARRNPSAAEASAHFHGEPHETKGGKVVLGEVEQIEYRAPRRSQRAGLWSHKFGDYGLPLVRGTGRPLLVADPNTGRVQLEQGTSHARFQDRLGIVG